MISIVFIFWMYVILFAVIGMLRGWAKELLVGFAVVVAVALNFLLHQFAPMVKDLPDGDLTLFWIRSAVLGVLTYFGYQTVISVARLQAGARRERLQDALFGLFLGAINGYLVMGTFWSYWAEAGYPGGFVQPAKQNVQAVIDKMLEYMPPHLLGEPGIYFAVIIVL
ncbi:MAG: CvpA family protein, partial [Anaerolineales bacterium]|nr:CvpA family protein [Anaerolineales bacterium]